MNGKKQPTDRWTRRDVLRRLPAGAAALAAGSLLSGCSKGGAPGGLELDDVLRRLDGGFVGHGAERGHLLRDGVLRDAVPAETREVGIAIVGAGIAGLSAAWALDRAGYRDFEILELEDQAGGNAQWGENAVSAYPWGAHYLPTPTREARATRTLLEEMGLVVGFDGAGEPLYDPRHLCHAPQERVHLDGAWRWGLTARDLLHDAPPAERAELDAFERQVALWGRSRAADQRGETPSFALPMELSSTDDALRALDAISFRDWIDRAGWHSPRLRWYLDYCCRDDYGCDLADTSAWAGWHYFCSRPQETADLTWPEGNGRLVRHLLGRVEDRLRTARAVFRIRVDGAAPTLGEIRDGAELDVLDARSGPVERIRARRVIFALPRFLAPRLLDGYRLPGIESFTYSPWLVANLTVRRLPDEAAWDNVFLPSRSLGYVVATHQNLRAVPGESVLTWYLPLSGADPASARRELQEHGWEEWTSRVLADLAGVHPEILDLVTRVDLRRWGHAMIRPIPGFLTGEARRRAAEPWGPVRFAHSDMSGLSLFEEAQYRGVAAAEALLREFGAAAPTLL